MIQLDYGYFLHSRNYWTLVDTKVYLSDMTSDISRFFRELFVQYPTNSNYFSSNSQTYDFKYTYYFNRYQHGNACFVHVTSDEFDALRVCEIYYTRDYYKIVLYSAFFRWISIYGLDEKTFLSDLLSVFDFSLPLGRLIRLDFAFDVRDVSVQDTVYNLRKDGNYGVKTRERRDKKGQLETMEFGGRDGYVFLRVYNKKLDSLKKLKTNLYRDYPDVCTRIEFQLEYKFIGSMSADETISTLFSYMGLTDSDRRNYYQGKRYNEKEILDPNNYGVTTARRFVKRIQNGYDPRDVLSYVNKRQTSYTLRSSPRSGQKKPNA